MLYDRLFYYTSLSRFSQTCFIEIVLVYNFSILNNFHVFYVMRIYEKNFRDRESYTDILISVFSYFFNSSFSFFISFLSSIILNSLPIAIS